MTGRNRRINWFKICDNQSIYDSNTNSKLLDNFYVIKKIGKKSTENGVHVSFTQYNQSILNILKVAKYKVYSIYSK